MAVVIGKPEAAALTHTALRAERTGRLPKRRSRVPGATPHGREAAIVHDYDLKPELDSAALRMGRRSMHCSRGRNDDREVDGFDHG
jgi:hypothetical protein